MSQFQPTISSTLASTSDLNFPTYTPPQPTPTTGTASSVLDLPGFTPQPTQPPPQSEKVPTTSQPDYNPVGMTIENLGYPRPIEFPNMSPDTLMKINDEIRRDVKRFTGTVTGLKNNNNKKTKNRTRSSRY